MRLVKSALAVLALLVFSSNAAYSLTVSARAYGLYVNTPSLGVTNQTYCDTGWLPSSGGNAGETVMNFSVVGIASGDLLGSSSDSDDCMGISTATFMNGVILPGHPGEITFLSLSGSDDDKCCNPDDNDDDDDFSIQGLTFGGISIAVTGLKNQTYTIPGVGVLTINEIVSSPDDDCDVDDFTVLGLHLRLSNGEEIIVGSVRHDSEDDCCTVPAHDTTWGAIKNLFTLGQ